MGITFNKSTDFKLNASLTLTGKSVKPIGGQLPDMNTVACEVMWIMKILTEFGITNSLQANVNCDNSSAIQIGANPILHERTKHFEIELFFLREKVVAGIVKTVKVKSEDNIADFFTKGLSAFDHENFADTADSGKKKEVKAFTFHRMETEEVCEHYITPCFVEELDAYDGVTDLEYEKNLISNKFAVKLSLQYEIRKNAEKIMNRELLVAFWGELYFVGFVINPEEDDVEPCVIFGCSFLKLTKALDALLASINVEELPKLDQSDFPPFVCNIRKNLRNKKKPSKTYKMSYDGEGSSLSINRPRTQEELTKRK
ncbi:reverse transcriptase domain-containing protein [Tanacetum coccineum]